MSGTVSGVVDEVLGDGVQGDPRAIAAPARPSPLPRAVRLYLDHLQVERGLAANSMAAATSKRSSRAS